MANKIKFSKTMYS